MSKPQTQTELDDAPWSDCWDCGGAGEYADTCVCEEFVDTCCCDNPVPQACRTCKGDGGWYQSEN